MKHFTQLCGHFCAETSMTSSRQIEIIDLRPPVNKLGFVKRCRRARKLCHLFVRHLIFDFVDEVDNYVPGICIHGIVLFCFHTIYKSFTLGFSVVFHFIFLYPFVDGYVHDKYSTYDFSAFSSTFPYSLTISILKPNFPLSA